MLESLDLQTGFHGAIDRKVERLAKMKADSRKEAYDFEAAEKQAWK